jgi:lipoprotein-anchoring transpeptidase ErfK/SrfK
VVSQASLEGGKSVRKTTHFRTAGLTLDQQTYPSIAPLGGQTVGIGMPVIVRFDVPVSDKASIERHLHVVSRPAQKGAWHWISDTEVHWRPAKYWQAGTKVTVNADINSVPAGNGIFGQLDRSVTFNIGAAHIYKVDTRTDQMRVFSNGTLLRTVPITTGQQPQYTTRSGTKVIIEKFPSKDMNSETVGISGADAYNIKGVQWAMRVTYSGEFVHAAPWSVADQGHANVSHGCTGMSTANADWLYHMTNVGDVVQYTGTDRPMTLTNGYGDWNEPFSLYQKGSALR